MADRNAKPKTRACPNCGKTTVVEFRPFCCKRCADLDLGRWLGGEYRFATEEEAETEDEFRGDDFADEA